MARLGFEMFVFGLHLYGCTCLHMHTYAMKYHAIYIGVPCKARDVKLEVITVADAKNILKRLDDEAPGGEPLETPTAGRGGQGE